MLLAFDIGNTLTDIGLFSGSNLLSTFKIKSSSNKSLDEYRVIFASYRDHYLKKDYVIDRIIISSVVPSLTRIWSALLLQEFKLKPLIVGPGLHSGLHLKVDNPNEVGSDLVSDAVGATSLYGHSLFIADLGTANKYLFIDKDAAFSGLVIAPGLSLSLEALVNGTAALPEISLLAPAHVMGKNTVDCMNSGLINGQIYEIQGFAKSFEEECGYPLKYILTGGNAIYVKDYLPSFTYEEPLLLKGLYEISRRNEK